MKKNRSKPASVADLRIPLMVCVLIGVFLLAVYTVVVSFTTLPPSLFGIILTVIYIYGDFHLSRGAQQAKKNSD